MLSTIIKTALSSLRFRVCRCRFRRHECGRHLRVAEFLLGVSAGSFQPGHTISFSIQLDSNAQLQVFYSGYWKSGAASIRAGNILNLLRTDRNPSLSNASPELQGSGIATRFGVDQHRRNSASAAPPQSTGTRRGTFKSWFQQYP